TAPGALPRIPIVGLHHLNPASAGFFVSGFSSAILLGVPGGRGPMSAELLWIVIGIGLILSELIATGVVAVFLGSSAILTGLLLSWGLIEAPAVQFSIFGIASLLQLLLMRGRAKAWFLGHSSAPGPARSSFQNDVGDRVTVVKDFQHG